MTGVTKSRHSFQKCQAEHLQQPTTHIRVMRIRPSSGQRQAIQRPTYDFNYTNVNRRCPIAYADDISTSQPATLKHYEVLMWQLQWMGYEREIVADVTNAHNTTRSARVRGGDSVTR